MVVVALIAATTGCETNPNETETTKTDPYIGGTRGLVLQFAEGAPPDEVFDNKEWEFPVELKLQNVGEADIDKKDVSIKLGGLIPSDFGKKDSDFIKNGIGEDIIRTYKDFEGNTISSPDVFVTFPDLSYQYQLSGNKVLPIRAEVCYSYMTEATADGCVREDVLSIDEDAVCQVNEEKTVHNSGGPIQVTQFLEQPSGADKIRYMFTIEHQGSGNVYLPGSGCPSDRTKENKVYFEIESNVADLECTGLSGGDSGKKGEVLLNEGKRVISCAQQAKSKLDYIDTIKITLKYDYEEFTQKDILIKKSTV